MKGLLNKKFFERGTVAVAKDLLGKYLVKRAGKRELAFMITEVEAYDGHKDKAAHGSRGKTARNAPMFGEAGKWYVYFTYGMHWMLNIVTGPKDYPAAVLIRGVEGINGPGRVTNYLRIDKSFNNKPARRVAGLWIEDKGVKIKPRDIKSSARIGIDFAGKYWSSRKYRFYID
ncbi:MAG: DNA-3-methyladenine glycosylase [Candidatus Colwellbacteria bacterium]|nr:DNA-3-methyladenine glycosylase [Candidatus Colwellbacteria bacterium]